MDSIMPFITQVNGWLWGIWTFYILLGVGILFTIWTRFSQFKVLGHGVAVTRGAYDDPHDPGAINHFQALSAALSATIGLGNIGGVAIAISLGGPGALFWMWVVGFLGMAIKSVEITLVMLYRNTKDPDDPHGGAMWVIDEVLGSKGGWAKVLAKSIGVIFCVTLIIMTMTGGNMFQTWNVADLTLNYFDVPKIVTGIVLAIIVGLVIVGGIKRIGQVAGRLVPVMCILYLISAMAVLAVNIDQIPGLLMLIFSSAFGGAEAEGAFVGGTIGFAFKVGLQRALFSNEAGLGSAPIAHAAAKTSEPAREGIVGGLGPFIDTLCICTLTALVILSTGTWNREADGAFNDTLALTVAQEEGAAAKWAIDGPSSLDALPTLPGGEEWRTGWQFFVLAKTPDAAPADAPMKVYGNIAQAPEDGSVEGILPGQHYLVWKTVENSPVITADMQQGHRIELDQRGAFRNFAGATLTGHAFDRAFPGLGKWLVTLAAWLFAISTMISWSYYGEQGMIYMLGKASVLPYKIAFLGLAVVGAFLVKTDAELGALADFGTGGMLLANMLIVLTCGHLAVRALRDYFDRLDRGEFQKHKRPTITDVVAGKDV
jgi:AGCS family alanine or glycine:cation symporter